MNRLIIPALLIAALGIPAVATATDTEPIHKVVICHALPEDADHDYNQQEVDIASSGFVQGGHHVPGGAIGDKHEEGGDIIPPYEVEIEDENGDPVTFEYPGQNWTVAGIAIYRNDCEAPEIVVPDPQCTVNCGPGGDPPGDPPGGDPPNNPPPVVPVVEPPPVIPVAAPLALVIPQPPIVVKNERYEPRASIIVCGDPRAKITYDNSASTLPSRFKLIYRHPVTLDRIVKNRTLKAGATFVTEWRWVKGNGNFVRVRDQYQRPLAIARVLNPTPWGQASCPKGLYVAN